jgi:formylmethanofuran dehydrogenase subunit A
MTEVEILEEIVVIAEAVVVDLTAAAVVAGLVDKAADAQADKVVEGDKLRPNKKKSFNRNKTGLIEAITSNFKPQTSN